MYFRIAVKFVPLKFSVAFVSAKAISFMTCSSTWRNESSSELNYGHGSTGCAIQKSLQMPV